jgi:hypothetical protein
VIWRPLVASLIMAASLELIRAAWHGPSVAVELFSLVAFGIVVYIGSALLLWRLSRCPAGGERIMVDLFDHKLKGIRMRLAR